MKKAIGISLLLCVMTTTFMQGAERTSFSYKDFENMFLKGLREKDQDIVVGVLVSDDINAITFVAENSLASKLYNILMSVSTAEDFSNEARQTPFENIRYMAKQMAITGGNTTFLANMGE